MFTSLLFWFTLSVGLCLCDNFAESNLELAFVIFRHGERTPETNEEFPTDQYKIEYFHPLTYGQLTNEGKRRQYQLGKKLRNRYKDFLGELYIADEVVMYSTDWDRTKTSALLTLAGMFPPHKLQQWDKELNWLPIPYQFKPFDEDYLIRRPDHYCSKYVKELKNVMESAEVREIIKKYRKTFEYVTISTKRNMTDFHEIFRIFQNLHSKSVMNLTMPDWAGTVYPEPLQTIAAYQCVFENYNNQLIRLNGGHILQKFIQFSSEKINGMLKPAKRKMFLYSGHENNIVNILAVLGVFDHHLPPYCSAVMFELHKKTITNEYGFKIFYDNSTFTSNLVLPGCSAFCPFEQFINLTASVVPINYTAECESPIYLD